MKLKNWILGTALAAMILTPLASVVAKPIEINWWHAMKSARLEATMNIVNDFNNMQKKYKVIATNKGKYDQVIQAGVAAFRARKQPHLMQVFEVGTLTMMRSGAIYPVQDLMKNTGHSVDWSGYLQPVLTYYMTPEKELLSMPFNSSTAIMYYNKDMFRKAGLKRAPRTWQEVGQYTKKLVDSGAKCGMTTAWQSWVHIENYSAIHNLPLATKGNGFGGLDTKLTINNPQVIKHIARLKSWMKDGRFSYEGQKYQGGQAAFVGQKCAIFFNSISGIGKLKKSAKFNWEAAPMPYEEDMKNPLNSIIGGASLWVLKGHSKKEYQGVAEFLAFLANGKNQARWHKQTGYLPITLAAYDKLKKEGFYKKNPLQEVGIKQLTRGTPTPNSMGIRLGGFVQIRDVINDEMERVWMGKVSPKRGMDNAVKRSNIILRNFERRYQ